MTSSANRPAAFLDRDGVLNVDTCYPHRPDELLLTPSAAQGVRLLNDAGYLVIVVTNQSGVARGLFGLDDVDRFNQALADRLAAVGGRIDAFYVCPYHPDGSVARYACDHPDRKPNPGMLLRAMADWPIDRDASVMIGDKPSDMEAACRAGVAGLTVEADVCDLAAAVSAWLSRSAP